MRLFASVLFSICIILSSKNVKAAELLWTLELPEHTPVLDEQKTQYGQTKDGRLFVAAAIYEYKVRWVVHYYAPTADEIKSYPSARSFIEIVDHQDPQNLKTFRTYVARISTSESSSRRISIFFDSKDITIESIEMSAGKATLLINQNRYIGLIKTPKSNVIKSPMEVAKKPDSDACDTRLN